MRLIHLFTFFLFLNLQESLATTQEYLFNLQHIGTNDGLAGLMCNTIYKDRKGLIWIGTNEGLNRYNGYSFAHYTKESNGLFSNAYLKKISEDEQGYLWLFHHRKNKWLPDSTLTVIEIFDPKVEKTIALKDFYQGDLPFELEFINIAQIDDPQNRLWITTTKGELFLYEDGCFKRIFQQENTLIQYLTAAQNGDLWIGYDQAAICLSLDGQIKQRVELPNPVFGIYSGKNDQAWFACRTLIEQDGMEIEWGKFRFGLKSWEKQIFFHFS